MEKLFWQEKTKEKFFENLIQHMYQIDTVVQTLCCFTTTYSRASTYFYIRRWRKSKKCPSCQNSISLNFWRFGNRHETDHTITRLYRIFFLPLKEEEFFFFPQLILSSHFFAKMDFALQTNQLKSHSKYPLTWTAILVVDCMMQAFYNTAKEGVAHLTINWNVQTLTIFPLSLAIFTWHFLVSENLRFFHTIHSWRMFLATKFAVFFHASNCSRWLTCYSSTYPLMTSSAFAKFLIILRM